MKPIKQYPLISFFILAYGIFWLIWIPLTPHLQNLAAFEIAPWVIPLALIGIYAPTFAALIVVAVSEGRTGLKRLIAPLWDWRLHWRWYLIGVFLPTLLAGIAVLIELATTGRLDLFFSFGWLGTVPLFLVSIPLTLLAKLPLGPMAEELGWRGFALPRIMMSFQPLSASLLLGAIWGVFHLPLYWQKPLFATLFLALTPALSIFITWLFQSARGSVLVCALFHAVYNAWGQAILPAEGGETLLAVTVGLFWVVALYLATIVRRA